MARGRPGYRLNTEKVWALRKRALRMRQGDLAQKMGVSTNTVMMIETGRQVPLPNTVDRLAEALGVHPDDLLIWDHDVAKHFQDEDELEKEKP